MSLRILKVHAPAEAQDAVRSILERTPCVDSWEDHPGNRYEANLLLDAADAEAAMESFTNGLGGSGYRLVLTSVEATAPRPPDRDRDSGRLGREELYQDVSGQARMDTTFLMMAGLSALVAAVGLLRDSTALVIGAMVLAPLLGPNVALALATTLGDVKLARRALRTSFGGLAVAAAVAVVVGMFMPVDPTVPELAARTEVGFSDLAVALASGVAAALTLTSSVPGSLVGVAVAVALVPPLVAAGLLLGTGDLRGAGAALLLVAVNVTAINLAAMATLLARGVRPGTWVEAERAGRRTRRAAWFWGILLAILAALLWYAGPLQT